MYKASDIASYFIHLANLEEDGNITNMKLQKLLYYAQGFHLALLDRPLFTDEIRAWQYGPVIPEIYVQYKDFGRNSLPENKDFNPEKIDSDTRDLIDEVYSVFGKYTGTVLANLTHQEKPWTSTEKDCAIAHDLMRDYFKSQLVAG
ncbi:SocA family protein [Limnothrix sp. FACHB-881]|uniref:Panacea domain-containing protein n=1 Tax=Limnothrix sp. FACHB-881 TaxID=2692819 RepID=UPI0016888A14|nr:type II toxin-antitoxin system antitoxin SocA domain-containing protein [Limnothrix sp. FACHB-881]MBD2637176.1 SocA family protein [Limnothrix sp. FACHB-881]